MFQIGDIVTLVNDVEGFSDGPCKGGIVIPAYREMRGKVAKVLRLSGGIRTTVRVGYEDGEIQDVFPWRLEHVHFSLENK
jgi:hypothetical protein